jgi:hypothetical protein
MAFHFRKGNTVVMKTTHRNRGFALIELPLVLFILALIGFAAVVAVRLLSGPVAWYWWPVGFVALPAAFIAYALCFGVSDEFGRHRRRNSN